MSGGPIFIVGAMGAGTTLLRLMLDSHPDIAIPRETGFMRAYNAQVQIPFKWAGRNWAKRMGWSRRELDRELAAFYDRIFMRHAERQGKRRWGEKCPLHTWHVDGMLRLFPDAVVIGIVRHPGGCSASNMRRWRHGVGTAAYHYERFNKEIARQATLHPDRVVVVRYEDLVLEPEATLRELLEWLGEPWSPDVLRHHDVQAARGGKDEVEGRTRVGDPLDAARVDRWTRSLNGVTRRRLRRRLGRLGELFGYRWEDPVPREQPEPGSRLIRGSVMVERVARFPDLDVGTRMPVPKYERPYHPAELKLADVVPAWLRAVPAPVRDRLLATVRGVGGRAVARARGR
jgi:Sulfotransferase family